MTSASETTQRLKQRVLFADKIIQQTAFERGLKNHIVLEGGSGGAGHGATSYYPFHQWRGGAVETTQAEVDSYIASVPGNPVSTTSVPDAPTDISAVSGNTEAVITFTVPVNNGGSPITGYKVISSPPTTVITGSSSPITFTGLTNGVSYTFTVIATNSVGDSTASTPSNSVTPTAPAARTPGVAKLAATFFDNANLGYTTLYNTFSRMATDSLQNTIVAGLYRTDTLTLNAADTDGIAQIPTMTETFDGPTNVVQGMTTYYISNIFVAKYSATGVPAWSAKISGTTNQGMTVYSVVCDSQNNVYALVAASGTVATANVVSLYNADGSLFGSKSNVFGFGNFNPARYFLVKYNASGVIQWVNSITAGDNNSAYLFAIDGNLAIDSTDAVYMSTHVQRAGGGSGPSTITYYKYGSVSGGVIQDTVQTVDSYAFGGSPAQYHRGHLVKLDSAGNYTWIARMTIPTAWGENNGGGVNSNIVIDGANNVYLCQNVVPSASSPTCNIYSGVAATSNPLPALSSTYYRFDLRGNSISPSLPQYYRYVAIMKFDTNGVFLRASSAHQLINGSVALSMAGYIGINKVTNELYMTMNAQGYVGTNLMSGIQLNALYIDSFSQNAVNGSFYDIQVANSIVVPLAQPQTILAVVKFNADLQAQAVAYIDTPGYTSAFNTYGPVNPVSVDSSGNVYIATTIKDTASVKTVYTFSSLSGTTPSFGTFGTIAATSANTDGLIVSYNGVLTVGRWATLVASSDGLNDNGFSCAVNSDDYLIVGGNTTLDKTAGSNTVTVNSFSGVSGGAVQNTVFGNVDVTNAVDRVGFLIKYE